MWSGVGGDFASPRIPAHVNVLEDSSVWCVRALSSAADDRHINKPFK